MRHGRVVRPKAIVARCHAASPYALVDSFACVLYRRIDVYDRPPADTTGRVMARAKNCLRALGRTTLTKAWAVWFVTATALPFTAPFATLTVADVWGPAHPSTALATVSSPSTCRSQQDDSADDLGTSDICGQRTLEAIRWVLMPMTTSSVDRTLTLADAPFAPAHSTAPLHDTAILVVPLRL